MTYSETYCVWCGGVIPGPAGGSGRPRRYCRRSHRQRAYEARQFASRRRIDTGEILLSETGWTALTGALSRLQTATATVVEQQDAGAAASLAAALGRLNAAVAELQDSLRPNTTP